jgi:hypothetical protein
MPLVRATSFDDQSGILDSQEYPGGEPRHDALLVGEFDHSKIMANMLQVLNLRVMEMAGSSPVALAKSSNSTLFSSAN